MNWKIMADPEWKGVHPCHDYRYIVTEDFNEQERTGEIICAMRDCMDQQTNARLIAAIPKMMRRLIELIGEEDFENLLKESKK